MNLKTSLSAFDVFALNETWLDNRKSFKVPNFNIFRRDRQSGHHGGVCLLVKQHITSVEVPTIFDPSVELIAVKLLGAMAGNKDVVIISYYNPPDKKISEDVLCFAKNMALTSHVLLVGDLNAHNISWHSNHNNSSGLAIEKFLTDDDFVMVNNNQHTFTPLQKPGYGSIIDLVLVSSSLSPKVSNFSVTDEFQSDHNTVQLFIDAVISHDNLQSTTKTYINWDKLAKNFDGTSGHLLDLPLNTNNDIDAFVAALTSSIQTAVKAATWSKKVMLGKHLHTLPSHVLNIIKEKRKARKQFQQSGLPHFKSQFNKLSGDVHRAIRKHKQEKWTHFCNTINGMHISDSKLWQKLRKIETANEPAPRRNPSLVVNNQVFSNPGETCNIFADTLEQVFKDNDDPEFDANFKREVTDATDQFFKYGDFVPKMTNVTEIGYFIKKLRSKGAPGLDQITNKIIKSLPVCFKSILARLFNACFNLSYFPSIWKSAVIIMIPKPQKDHKIADNFRPISLLPTLSKLFERIICDRLEDWMLKNNIIVNHQSGFRKNHQTRDQLLRIIQSGLSGFNRKQKMGAVFIDIQKAFDSVWHTGLLWKLHKYAIPQYLGKLLQSYLLERSFVVRVNQSLSLLRPINSGVPQGSVLGPILFLLFFNDIPCTDKTTSALFADDLCFWYSHGNLRVINNRLQNTLDKIKLWLSTWRLKLNVDKTTFCVFNKPSRNLSCSIRLSFSNNTITYDHNPKFLGVFLDPGLIFNHHIRYLKQRTTSRLNMLKSLRGRNWGASQNLLLISYKVLVRSLLDYCPFIAIISSKANYLDIERIQRKALRIALRMPYDTPIDVLYESCNLMNIKDRAFFLTDKYICKAVKFNQLIAKQISDYKLAGPLDEGLFANHSKKRSTLFGFISSSHHLASSKLFI